MTTHIRTQDKSALHHFSVVHKMGFPEGRRCVCGAELAFKPHEPGQDAKRKAFFDAHEECQPREMKTE